MILCKVQHLCGFVWKQGTSKSLDSLSSLYNIHPYVHIYMYMVSNICMHWCKCLILVPKTCNLTTGYPPKLIITHLFKQNMFQLNILWLSRMVKHITEYHIILVLSQYIPLISHWYPTDIDLHAGTCSSAQGHQLWSRLFLWSRAQLVSDSNLETLRTDSLKGFKRISQWFINKIQENQENIVTWLYKLKLYMSRCIR